MEKMEELAKFTTKEQRENFKVAAAQLERQQGAAKKRKRPAAKKGNAPGGKKPSPAGKPNLVKCSDCGRNGHLPGDAKCMSSKKAEAK